MNIIFYGARQAGLISLLTLMALKENIVCVIPCDDLVEKIAKRFNLKIFKPQSLNTPSSIDYIKKLKPDLFVCCHGREILKKDLLTILKFNSINIHPCLYKYKGAHPIKRLLRDKETKASVAVHYMTEEIDQGEVIIENFVNVKECKTEIEVYNKLYPYYSFTLLDALKKIKLNLSKKNGKNK